jgi:beta-mannosidase
MPQPGIAPHTTCHEDNRTVTRNRRDLGGNQWYLGSVPPKPLESRSDDRAEVKEWLPVTVPGNVRNDLLTLGRIEDPFFGTNNEACQWVDDCDWWYTRPLELDLDRGERAFLCFEGIYYISSVYLDEVELGRHEGMFSRQVYEISELVRSGRSEVAVRIWGSNSLPRRGLKWWERLWSPVATVLQRGQEAFPQRSATLKCQMSFGWDFAPRLRTMGIWDDATLRVTGSVFVSDVFVEAQPENEQAHVTVRATLDSTTTQRVIARVEVRLREHPSDPDWTGEFPLSLASGQQIEEMTFTLPDAQLWHPWDRGKPHIYELELRIVQEGRVLDSLTESFGIRKLDMARNPDAPLRSEDWTLVINDSPLFIRGANWVPMDALPGRLQRENYQPLITMAGEAGINLLRVWGGGLREKRAFYDLCDEQGIMVWQEFPLACLLLGHLPRSTRFRNLLRQEGTGIVRQLRNHPSLVLWCGGNEFSYLRNHRLVNDLEGVVRAEDGTRPFRKTSPGKGDTHNWLIWHGKAPIREYQKDTSPFVSEFGLQSVPSVTSLPQFLAKEDLFPPNNVWRYHCAQLEKLARYLTPPTPNTLEGWVEASQRAQACGLQIAIEHWRRRKYRTSGTVIWQFNEPWPAISWSLVDYYGQPKLAWERLKSLYNPILISLEFPQRRYRAGDMFRAQVWGVNDLLGPCRDCLLEVDLDGERVFSRTISLPPDSSQPVDRFQAPLERGPRALLVRLRRGERVISSNEYDLSYYDPKRAQLLEVLYRRIGRWLLE